MTPTIQFLTALGQAFAAITLYADEHPMRQAAMSRLLAAIQTVLADGTPLRLSFIDGDVVAGARPVTELRGWDWGTRLSAAGVQRLELGVTPLPSPVDVLAMLTEMRARMAAPGEPARQWSSGSIRVGPLTIAVSRLSDDAPPIAAEVGQHTCGLEPELNATAYVFSEVAAGRALPMAEVDAVVHALALTLRHGQAVTLPLIDSGADGEYAAAHACNVSILSIALSEALGLSDTDARAIGSAALLHDAGNLRLPRELLSRPGVLTDGERTLIETHPIEGARILSARGPGNGLAATVAYEHHIWYNGRGGYPGFAFPRTTHFASRIVHVCANYDALCSHRPYREAWPRALALDLVTSLAGTELDPAIAAAFVRMASAATENRRAISDAAA